jgi:hypothetical protein
MKARASKAAKPLRDQRRIVKKRATNARFRVATTVRDQAMLTVVLQDAFDSSCATMIETFVNLGLGGESGDVISLVVNVPSTPFEVAGGVVFRRIVLEGKLVYEVLFLATRRHFYRAGLASLIVSELRRRLIDETHEGERILCVSIKNSDEAKSFWKAQSMTDVDSTDALYDRMVKFADFCPVMSAF